MERVSQERRGDLLKHWHALRTRPDEVKAKGIGMAELESALLAALDGMQG